MKMLRNNGIITKSEYVGKKVEEATEFAEKGGFLVRIVEKDGKHIMLDMSNRSDRLNFRVFNGVVTDVYGG